MRNKILLLSALEILSVCLCLAGCSNKSDDALNENKQEIVEATEDSGKVKALVLEKCTKGNPIAGDSDNLLYGGDPSVLVDGEKVYLYTGHDVSTDDEVKKSIYNIPEYLCYSSTDMSDWTAEGVVMSMKDVKWASNDTSAWASQVAKHYDAESGMDKYYLYYCSWDKSGKQCIGVAVSDLPTGPFEDIGQPLVKASITKPATSSYNDIDPTVWIETDEEGTEHRYLAWGNGIFYVCELNEDMISISDLNGDGEITNSSTYGEADIITRTKGLDSYTEAPWIYRRQDENGNYYGDYYLFFAHQWRECMAYATTDDLLEGEWSDTKMIMAPTATSNTNHMAVCDFKGEIYFIYHDGALTKGNGFRRSACIRKLEFSEDGSIEMLEETTAGVSGFTNEISLASGGKITHESFTNSTSDADYPYVDISMGIDISNGENDGKWVIRPGKADTSNENYVSIESENKTGLFFTTRKDGSVVLMHDTVGEDSLAKKQTFKTVEGLADKEGVSFESVFYEGEYLTVVNGELSRTNGEDKENATFFIR